MAKSRWLSIVILVLGLAPSATSQGPARFTAELLNGFSYRNLGPFRAGSWLTDFAAPEAPLHDHLYTFYIATRNGGVWKTTNNGTTFEPIFDNQNVSSIGAVAVAPSASNVVWVGTGESYNARSSYSGDGVYKSTDAGRTWTHMGLRESHHIAKIVVHPTNPEVVFVAAMGHLWTNNEERGLFKTIDGGKTWSKVLYVNDRVGVIDLVMNRRNPDVLYAAAYEKDRKPWHLEEGGPGSAIYKTTDGGKTWTKLEAGLPSGKIGRIGLDIYQKDPNILYAIVENVNPRPDGGQPTGRGRGGPRPIGGEVYRTDDGGATWKKTHGLEINVGGKAPYSFNILRVDPGNPERLVVTSDALPNSEDGGKTWSDLTFNNRRMFRTMFGDVRNVWFDQQDPKRVVLLSDGGLHISYDGGITADHYTNLPLGRDVHCRRRHGGSLQRLRRTAGSRALEGTEQQRERTDRDRGLDDRRHRRRDVQPGRSDGQPLGLQHAGVRQPTPRRSAHPHAHADHAAAARGRSAALQLGRSDPALAAQPGDRVRRRPDAVPVDGPWRSLAANQSRSDHQRQGEDRAERRRRSASAPSRRSPSRRSTAGVIWVGTDDGKVQVTRDGGGTWFDATAAVAAAGGPAELWVSRVFPSNFDAGTAYVSKTGFRADDFRPFLFKTTDFGKTWTRITTGLPDKPINVVVEDLKNKDLLFVGNDRGVYASIDGGGHWVAFRANMPTVPVHDMVIHPRENDLVVGTYGRGMWITDIGAAARDERRDAREGSALLRHRAETPSRRGRVGQLRALRRSLRDDPERAGGLTIVYYVKSAASVASITVADATGRTVRTQQGPAASGVNRVFLNLLDERRQPMPAGDYTVTVTVEGRSEKKTGRLEERPVRK